MSEDRAATDRFAGAIADGDADAFALAREASHYADIGDMPVWLLMELEEKDRQLQGGAP